MATQVRGRLIRRPQMVHHGPRARFSRADLVYKLFDRGDPGTTLKAIPVSLVYRASWFAGLSPADALLRAKTIGAGDVPSWIQIGQNLVADWDQAANVRAIPEGTEF